MKKTNKNLWLYLAAFLLPAILFSVLLFRKGMYPFGTFSIYTDDLEIQYHDFFCFLKDVLAGKAGFEYTFSKSLGGSPIAIIGYYLMSPFNLLIVFFKKSQIQMFIYIITSVKLGLCGLFSCIYIRKRFAISRTLCLVLAAAYSFTQYAVGQCSNIMWLDGMYLLPLIMLGIYLYVNQGKKLLFYVSCAGSIIICWYTGYMNCLFAPIYYLVERALCEKKFDLADQIKKGLRFAVLEILSVMLSCIVFLPVLLGQSSGRTFDEGVLDFRTNGKFLDIFRGFLIGSAFPSGQQITLFCTVFVLIFFFAFWICRKIPKKEKIVCGIFLGIMVASLFFKPLEHIWCGFKFEWGHSFRFAYLVTMTEIFIVGMGLKALSDSDNRLVWDRSLGLSCVIFIAILLLTDWLAPYEPRFLWSQIALIAFYALILYFITNKSASPCFKKRGITKKAAVSVLAIVFCAEAVLNASHLLGTRYKFSAEHNSDYTEVQQELINKLGQDGGFFRIEQTVNRSGGNENCKFYANESLAYGYKSLQTYTSSYDKSVADIIIKLGYTVSDFPSFYNNPILPADSFLGIKYLISDKEYSGYKETGLSTSGAKVYQNDYALPLGFAVDGSILKDFSSQNPFEYINELYSKSLGEKVEVFKKIEDFNARQDEKNVVFTGINAPSEQAILFIRFENGHIECPQLLINGQPFSNYIKGLWGDWDEVVYLGESGDIEEVTLCNANIGINDMKPQFYYVDMPVFEQAVNQLKGRKLSITEIKDGHIKAEYSDESSGQVLLTIPYDKGWKLKINGEKATLKSADGGFMVVPVGRGRNNIELKYSARGKAAGALLTVVSLAIFCFAAAVGKKKHSRI